MRRVRRKAGAERPASPTGSPRGPDPRPGRSRARLDLLPVLALLLGALSPFAAAPALAQGTTPAAPTSLLVEATGSGQLYVSWTAPTGTLTGYDVHYTSAPATGTGMVSNTAAASGSNPATAWVAISRGAEASPPTTNQAMTGLNDGTAYRIRVRAKNTNGAGTWAFGTGTPEVAQPLEVVNLAVTADHTTLSLSWDRNPSGDPPASYDVHYTTSTTASLNAVPGTNAATHWVDTGYSGSATSYTITGLTNGQAYRVRVLARNAGGNSPWEPSSGTPLARTVSLSVSPTQVTEGSSVTVTATLSRAHSSALTIPVTVSTASPNTAESGDVGALTSITVAANSTTGTGTISANQDADQDNETFTVSLGTLPSAVGAGSPTSVQVTINDDDTPAQVRLSASPNPVTEGSPVTVTATLSKALSSTVTIPVTVSTSGSNTAEAGDVGTLTSIPVSSGSTSGTGTITTNQDTDEDDETFTVSLGTSLPSSVTAGNPSSVTLTIVDNTTPTADATQITLVSNHGQTVSANHLSSIGHVQTQAFTTGSNYEGYALSAIEAVLNNTWTGTAQRETVRAELWSEASDVPDAKLADLTVPQDFATRMSFAAPENTVLTPDTDYYFVLYTTGTYDMGVGRVTTTAEDSGGAAGWSIWNTRTPKQSETPAGSASWTTGHGNPLRITVKGSVIQPTTVPAAPTNLNMEAGATEVSLIWTAPVGTLTGYDVHYTSASASGHNPVGDGAPASGSDPATGWLAVTRTGTTASQTISGLSPDTAYRVRVRATNVVGDGAWAFVAGRTYPVSIVLTSNLGQTKVSDFDSSSDVNAQGFTTGAEPYVLTSIETTISQSGDSAQRLTVRAELWSAATGGGPGSKLADLTVPLNVSPGTVSFGAPQDTVLSPGTTYYFVLYTVGTFHIGQSHATADAEDSGGQPGWSIDDTSWFITPHDVPASHEWFKSSGGESALVRVNGAALRLSVTADPGCGTAVSDSAQPKWQLRRTPAPAADRTVSYRFVDAGGGRLSDWNVADAVRPPYGYSVAFGRDLAFAELRRNFPGFAGYQFRLLNQPSVTASCVWRFETGGSGGSPPGGGSPPSGGGPPGGGGPPPSQPDDEGDEDDEDDEDDDGSGGDPPPDGGGGPPRAAIETGAACEAGLCRARTGAAVSFRDASTGSVRFRLWDFGDGRQSRSAGPNRAWSSPGFYEVTLTVGDGTVESTASLTFLVEAAEPAGICVADDESRCLRDSRFAVEMEWRTAEGGSGPGKVVREGTNNSGLFYFFDSENWEMLVKVLDGCSVNGHVWVYGASATTLGYTIRVTDTVTGVVREYMNEDGRRADAIADSEAFAGVCGGGRPVASSAFAGGATLTDPPPPFGVEAASGEGGCTESATTMCLLDGRYEVSASWSSPPPAGAEAGDTGPGRVARARTPDSGLFYFFDPANWEMLVKVLDACADYGHHWVFAASATDLGLDLVVRDTVTGEVRNYVRDPGEPSPAVADLSAFPNACSND